MDKVYVLTLTAVSDGLTLINKVEVYKDKDKAKKLFDAEVNVYYENHDFTDYNILKSNNEFIAIHKEKQYNNYIGIYLIENNIII